MEESRRRAKLGRVSFSKHTTPQACSMKERMETIRENRAVELYSENSQLSTYRNPLEIPSSPDQAMEFLSRTWSPSSSDFFQILSSTKLVPRFEHGTEKDRKKELEEESEKNQISISGDAGFTVDQIFTLLSSGKLAQLLAQKHRSLPASWMSRSQMKAWLGGNVLTNLTRGGRKRRKEEMRLHGAQVHAALSVTRLAAAIAGIVANSSLQPVNSKDSMSMNYGLGGSMNKIVASAAALVATVCAEAAESVGANREQVASVIATGLATQNSADMATLTATAATCLRGAATLEVRAAARRHISEDQKILARGTQLPVRVPEGRIQLRTVSIYLKNDKLALKLGKRHMGGVISTYKEYRIFDTMKNSKEGVFSKDVHNIYPINLSTTGGTIQVLFEDLKLYGTWNTTISHLLYDC